MPLPWSEPRALALAPLALACSLALLSAQARGTDAGDAPAAPSTDAFWSEARPAGTRSDTDPDESAKPLPEMTVTGRALPDPIERIERRQAKDIREIFAEEPSIDVGGGTRNGQRLYLRGIEGTNLNISFNGARQGQNLYNHRGGLSNVDPELLKRVDIQPGPPAADDGHGALGGSLRFVTIDAQDRLQPGQRFGGLIRGAATTADDTLRTALGAFARLGAGDAGLLAYASYSDFDNLRIGGGERVPFSAGRDRTWMTRLSLLDLGDSQLRVGIERNEATGLNFMQRGDYPWQLQPVDLRARPPVQQELTRQTVTAEWRYQPVDSWLDLRVQAYENDNEFLAPASNGENFISVVRGFDVRNDFRYQWGDWSGVLTAGVDGFTDRGTNIRNNREPRRNRYQNTGLFVQSRLGSERGSLSAGLRYDDFETRIRNSASANSKLLFNLGGLLDLGAGFAAFAGYGEAVRGAGTIPIHFAGNAVETLLFNGSADGRLDPEVSEQTELGLRWNGDLSGGTLGVELLGFRTRIRNPITYLQPGTGGLGNRPVTGFDNADLAARFSGTELRATYALGDTQAFFGISRLSTRDLPAQPQFLARFGAPTGDRAVLTLTQNLSPALSVGYTVTGVRRLSDVQANQIVFIPKAGYSTHDLFANWNVDAVPGLSLAFAVRNLSDRLYIRHGTFTQDGFATQEPGRDFRLSLAYSF